MSHVELYEAIKEYVGEVGARMIADVVPPAKDLATKHDLSREIADLRVEMRDLNTRTIRWYLGVSIPMWAGMWATMFAVLLRT